MILVDTSAWVELLRATGSRAHLRLRELLQGGEALATTEVVVMEVLAGAQDDAHLDRMRRALLGRCQTIAGHGLGDYEDAAAIYRHCRSHGATLRGLTDCVVAAVAIRAGVPVLHADQDFEQIARLSRLTTVPLD